MTREEMDKAWVDQVISVLETAKDGVLNVQIDGHPVAVTLGNDVVAFFKANKAMLLRIGMDTFRSFLLLVDAKKDEEAFLLLLGKMNADEMIAKIEADAQALQQINDDHDQFMAALKDFVERTLLGLASKALIAIITPYLIPLIPIL